MTERFFSRGSPADVILCGVIQLATQKEREIYRLLRGSRGISEDELLQHTVFFAKEPVERCRISLQSARLSAQRVIASKKAAARDKDKATLPVLERTLRLAKKLKKAP